MPIIQYINKNLGLKLKSETELPFVIQKHQFSRNQLITGIGDVEDRVYFIDKGMVQISIPSNNSYKVIDFFFRAQWFSCFTSFLNRGPSDVEARALLDSKVEAITYDELHKSYSNSILANQFGRHVVEQLFLLRIKKEKDAITKSAELRYREMLKDNPEMIHSIPVGKLAKYLGIYPESLSRIRKAVTSK